MKVQKAIAIGTWQIVPSGSGRDAREDVNQRIECAVLFGRICELRFRNITLERFERIVRCSVYNAWEKNG